MSHLLYQLYELRLRRQIRARPMPEHVGLILDGNRRSGTDIEVAFGIECEVAA
jgi:short-chain Z-isoprenyl diphosphate synthase